jgi:hypothetical protein
MIIGIFFLVFKFSIINNQIKNKNEAKNKNVKNKDYNNLNYEFN